VKITPGHDHDDYQTGLRHGLPAPTILAEDATVAETGTRYDGMDRYEARLAIVADLEGRGDLAAQRPHEMVIGRCQRSGDVVEPRIKTQWFVRTGPLAARALEATRSGRTRILPERFEKTWEHWLTNIRDWNVSRQLWWGHRIPAWYCPDGHVTVTSAETGPDACAVCGRPARELQQDPDIFDTWFSSGLWPWSTLGWPDDTPDLATFYPTSVMETGYDIIFFWVARMMMLGLELTGQEPFHTVYLSGLIRDPDGRKMSKTKGNVVDPLGVIDDAGADALRFAVIHGATPGNDQRFSDAKLEHARNFANKLWNATRYVTGARPSSIPEGAERRLPDVRHLGPAERWLLSRAAATTAAVDAAMAGYAFGEVTRLLYEAIWSEYCDWGLELAKVRLSDERLGADEREATWWTLVDVLDTYLRLLHPVMPFVTEALWGALAHRAGDPDLLIVARWPGVGERDADAEREVGTLIDLVTEIRNARASAKLPASDWLEALVYVPTSLGDTFEALRPAVERLARMRPLHRELTPEALASASKPGDLMVILGGGEIEAAVRPRATHDEAAELERDRLERDLEEAEGWLAAARERLANESFVSRAPASVVEGARAREAELADQVARLRDRTGR
jgi:valyl-tRNA synthetase